MSGPPNARPPINVPPGTTVPFSTRVSKVGKPLKPAVKIFLQNLYGPEAAPRVIREFTQVGGDANVYFKDNKTRNQFLKEYTRFKKARGQNYRPNAIMQTADAVSSGRSRRARSGSQDKPRKPPKPKPPKPKLFL